MKMHFYVEVFLNFFLITVVPGKFFAFCQPKKLVFFAFQKTRLYRYVILL